MPAWYKLTVGLWAVFVLPFHWFATGFNGLPFLSLPDAPGPYGPSELEWLLYVMVLFAPLLGAPIAFWQFVRGKRKTR